MARVWCAESKEPWDVVSRAAESESLSIRVIEHRRRVLCRLGVLPSRAPARLTWTGGAWRGLAGPELVRICQCDAARSRPSA